VVRATVILEADAEARNQHIADHAEVSAQTVRLWRSRWVRASVQLADIEPEVGEKALRALIRNRLADDSRSGRPGTFTPEQRCQIVAVACEAPALSGRPVTHWTPVELADEVIKRGIVVGISPRPVGRLLAEADLKPHQSRYWLKNQRARDPEQCDQDVKTVCTLYAEARDR
jgi:putative transposase